MILVHKPLPMLCPSSCSLPQATVVRAPCLRPANTDARAPLHHPETATPAVLSAAEVPAKDDAAQGEPETESFIQAPSAKAQSSSFRKLSSYPSSSRTSPSRPRLQSKNPSSHQTRVLRAGPTRSVAPKTRLPPKGTVPRTFVVVFGIHSREPRSFR
jgi:hypothetical protein